MSLFIHCRGGNSSKNIFTERKKCHPKDVYKIFYKTNKFKKKARSTNEICIRRAYKQDRFRNVKYLEIFKDGNVRYL